MNQIVAIDGERSKPAAVEELARKYFERIPRGANYPPDVVTLEVKQAAEKRMYAEAAYGPAEMDFLQLYDDYPVMEFVQLESLGFTAPGETARFLHSRDTTVRGTAMSELETLVPLPVRSRLYKASMIPPKSAIELG